MKFTVTNSDGQSSEAKITPPEMLIAIRWVLQYADRRKAGVPDDNLLQNPPTGDQSFPLWSIEAANWMRGELDRIGLLEGVQDRDAVVFLAPTQRGRQVYQAIEDENSPLCTSIREHCRSNPDMTLDQVVDYIDSRLSE